MKAAARQLAAILYVVVIAVLLFYAAHGVDILYFGGATCPN